MKNIFIIDDDETNNYIAEQMIKLLLPEVKFMSFIDPTEALSQLNSSLVHPDDVILVDLNMPKIDGWQFLEKFQKKNIACHVFILTTSLNPEDEQLARSNPIIKDFIIKPLSGESIKTIMNALK